MLLLIVGKCCECGDPLSAEEKAMVGDICLGCVWELAELARDRNGEVAV